MPIYIEYATSCSCITSQSNYVFTGPNVEKTSIWNIPDTIPTLIALTVQNVILNRV